MIAKLDIEYGKYDHKIRWIVDDGFGGAVGEGRYGPKPPKNPESRMCWLAFRAAKPFAYMHAGDGLLFESEAKARAALRAIRAALRADRDEQNNRPWPEWAKQAAAAGWRAPKRWTP